MFYFVGDVVILFVGFSLNYRPDMDPKYLKENYGKIMVGQHEAARLDQSFRDDPNKKARAPSIRGSSVSMGKSCLGCPSDHGWAILDSETEPDLQGRSQQEGEGA